MGLYVCVFAWAYPPYLYGEAWGVAAAGSATVCARPEGGGAGRLRRQSKVMVNPLAPLHQQVGQRRVQRDVLIVGIQHAVGHTPHLNAQSHNPAVSIHALVHHIKQCLPLRW